MSEQLSTEALRELAAEIREDLAAALDTSEPDRSTGAPDIGAWSWNDTLGRPAAWQAFGDAR